MKSNSTLQLWKVRAKRYDDVTVTFAGSRREVRAWLAGAMSDLLAGIVWCREVFPTDTFATASEIFSDSNIVFLFHRNNMAVGETSSIIWHDMRLTVECPVDL